MIQKISMTIAAGIVSLLLTGLISGCNRPPQSLGSPEYRLPDAPLLSGESGAPYVRVISGQEVRDPSQLQAAPDVTPVPESPLDEIRLDIVSFNNMPLSSVALMLTRMTGINIVPSTAAADRGVTVYLQKVTARAAVEAVCRLSGLWYREDGEIIRLVTREEYGREMVIRSNEQTRLYYLKYASAPGVAEMIESLMPGQVEYQRSGDESSYGHVGTDGDDPMSNPGGGRSARGSRGDGRYAVDSYDLRSGGVSRSNFGYSASDVATTYQQGLAAGRIAELAGSRTARQQGEVNVEQLAEASGVRQEATLSVFLRNNCIGVRSVHESIHDEIGKIISALDTPTRQVLLEVKVLRVSLGDAFESVFKFAYSRNNGGSQTDATWLGGSDIAGSTLSFSYLDQHIEATLKLLKTDDRLHSVATPMLLCANNAPAEFFSGVTRMITTNYDFETRYGENNEAVDIARPIVEERGIGTMVRIKPSINTDGTITLRFRLELSSVNPDGASIYEVDNNGNLIALPIDTVDEERAESIVVARHGQAVVMGGLISESITRNHRRVPVVGDIPIVGTFLGQRVDDVSRNETIMVIIPHIIATGGLENSAASEKVLKNNATHPLAGSRAKSITQWNAEKKRIEEVDLRELEKVRQDDDAAEQLLPRSVEPQEAVAE